MLQGGYRQSDPNGNLSVSPNADDLHTGAFLGRQGVRKVKHGVKEI